VKIKAVFGFKPSAGQSVEIVDIYMFHASPNEQQSIIFNPKTIDVLPQNPPVTFVSKT